MTVKLDPKSEKELLRLARKNGKEPAEVLRELLHQAAKAVRTSGRGKSASRDTARDPAHETSRTALGRRLRALSRKYVERGGKLLTVEEINREVAENRGER